MKSQSDMYNQFLKRLNAGHLKEIDENKHTFINDTKEYVTKWLDINHLLNSLKKL